MCLYFVKVMKISPLCSHLALGTPAEPAVTTSPGTPVYEPPSQDSPNWFKKGKGEPVCVCVCVCVCERERERERESIETQFIGQSYRSILPVHMKIPWEFFHDISFFMPVKKT